VNFNLYEMGPQSHRDLAEQNTAESLYAGLRRKETFATSVPASSSLLRRLEFRSQSHQGKGLGKTPTAGVPYGRRPAAATGGDQAPSSPSGR